MTFTPKYSPDDLVWALIDNKAKELPILEVEIKWKKTTQSITYWLEIFTPTESGAESKLAFAEEKQVFKTKQELIDSL